MGKHGGFNGWITIGTLRNRVFDARTGLGLSPMGRALEKAIRCGSKTAGSK
jgi:hypothetical protein